MNKITAIIFATLTALCVSLHVANADTIESYDAAGRERQWKLEPNGGMPVNLQDQTSPIVIVHMNRTTNTTALTVAGTIDDTTITVASVTGFVAGSHITLVSVAGDRFTTVHQVGAVAGLVVTLDTPLDYAYDIATTQVSVGVHDLSSTVGTLASPVIYSVRAGDTDPGILPILDVTRLIFTCTDTTAVDFTGFCGGAVLTNGIVLRRTDGTQQNIFNIKSNQGLANIMYDFTVLAASSPVQGIDGFVGRLTFGGQSKIGVVIRIGPGEDLELLIQDDLTGLTSFEVVAEGHLTVDED